MTERSDSENSDKQTSDKATPTFYQLSNMPGVNFVLSDDYKKMIDARNHFITERNSLLAEREELKQWNEVFSTQIKELESDKSELIDLLGGVVRITRLAGDSSPATKDEIAEVNEVVERFLKVIKKHTPSVSETPKQSQDK